MNFLLTIYIPDLVVLFGSGFGGSQAPQDLPSFLTSFRSWFALPPLSPVGPDDFGAIFSVCLLKRAMGREGPSPP